MLFMGKHQNKEGCGMKSFSENNITDAVLDRLKHCKSERVHEISVSLVKHMHNFVREVEPTQAEWEQGIKFLTDAGNMCNEVRQEFILMSDALGVSMLVDAINHRFPGGATETTVLGPFYVDSVPVVPLESHISNSEDGPEMLIEGRVVTLEGMPLVDATVNIWHSDDSGHYDVQKNPNEFSSRAKVKTDADGNFRVFGAIPAPYPIPNDGPVGQMLEAQGRHPFRPAHVHFLIEADGYETLVTHLFLEGSEYLDSDVVFGVKESLIERVEMSEPGTTKFGSLLGKQTPTLRREFILATKK
jgi:hydroxyquinol 1,2-dioxygenase